MADDSGEGGFSTAAVDIRSDHSDSIDGVDFISSLPDEILQHILSYLLTKTAIRTSLLSKRWKHIWSNTPSLSIDFDPMTAESINKTLTRHTAPKITSCHLCATSLESEPYVERWIEFAMSRDAEILSLELGFQGFHKYSFPDIFYINSSVKRLSVDVSFSTELNPRCTVSWTSLKELCLSKCYLSDECLANVLSGSPMLQSLTLYMTVDLRCLDLTGSCRLKRLKIVHDPPPGEPLEIVAPHILYLRLVKLQEACILADVSSLTEANFDISYLWKIMKPEDIQKMMLKTLEKFQNVKRLTFGPIFLQILSLAEFLGFRFPTLKVEALTLNTMIVRSVIPGIVKLLQNSPVLKKLTLHTEECNNLSDDDLVRYLDCQALKPNQWWSSKYGNFPILEGTWQLEKKNAEPRVLASFLDVVKSYTKTLDTLVIV